MKQRRKVMVIGVDGATFDVIQPLVEQGVLPNFAALMNRGSHCILKSTVPMLSPVAWTTFATGVRPGKHGIYNFLMRKDDTYEIVQAPSTMRRIKPVWKVAGEMGRRVAILNIPATFPPDDVNGLMIAGDPTPFHDARRVFPSEAYQELERTFKKNFMKPPAAFQTKKNLLGTLLHSVDLWTDVAKHVLKQQDWDLFALVYTATDTAQHFYWKDIDASHPLHRKKSSQKRDDAIRAVYRKIDWALGEFVQTADKDTQIVVLSDHGFGPVYQAVPLVEWFVEKKYLAFHAEMPGRNKGKFRDILRFMLSRLRLVEGFPPISFLKNVDWTATKAYFLGVSGDIYINLKGREPQGIVNPGREYDELVDTMAEELRGLVLPDGSVPVDSVLKGKDLYPGSAGAPDLFIQWAKGFDIAKEREPGNRRMNFEKKTVNKWSGTHMDNGILILAGSAIERGALGEAAIEDVAPTIYHLLGLPVPEMLEGRVLKNAINEDVLMQLRYTDLNIAESAYAGAAGSDDDTKKVAAALRKLGYIE